MQRRFVQGCWLIFGLLATLCFSYFSTGINSSVAQTVTPEQFAPGRTGQRERVSYYLPGKKQFVPIEYEVIDGWGITEGDIVLGRESDLRGAEQQRRQCTGELCSVHSPLIVRKGETYLWPAGVIPYQIDSGFSDSMKTRINQAIQIVQSSTNLILKPRSGERDYVFIKSESSGCSSPVGRQGRQQVIKISPGCVTGSIAHEILHSAGAWHEQSRSDRDRFVEILWNNIENGKRHNFEKHDSDGVDIGNYDYGSILHYSATAFGRDHPATGGRRTTIRTLQASASIGQRSRLSDLDVAGINSLYRAEDCLYFDPNRIQARLIQNRWKIVDGNHWLFDFGSNQREAEQSLAILRNYRANQTCYVGRPNAPFSYILASGRPPSGRLTGEDCIPFNPANLSIRKDGNNWLLSDGSSRMLLFSHPGDAYRALDIIQQYGFQQQCFVGRPKASFSYMRT